MCAHCTLLIPADQPIHPTAKAGLRALQENPLTRSSFFAIATRDMEVRGSGTLLGEVQHGHIQAVGFDTYIELLEEGIANARGDMNRKSDSIQRSRSRSRCSFRTRGCPRSTIASVPTASSRCVGTRRRPTGLRLGRPLRRAPARGLEPRLGCGSEGSRTAARHCTRSLEEGQRRPRLRPELTRAGRDHREIGLPGWSALLAR